MAEPAEQQPGTSNAHHLITHPVRTVKPYINAIPQCNTFTQQIGAHLRVGELARLVQELGCPKAQATGHILALALQLHRQHL